MENNINKRYKSFTSLEQSKKLAEILPLQSADMFYDGVQDLDKEMTFNIPIDGRTITVRTEHIITKEGIKANLLLPCWSLAALLEVLPKNLHTVLAIGEQEKYAIGSTDTNKYDCIADNPVDACVAMIIKLSELKML